MHSIGKGLMKTGTVEALASVVLRVVQVERCGPSGLAGACERAAQSAKDEMSACTV